jgi:hypothetical protein
MVVIVLVLPDGRRKKTHRSRSWVGFIPQGNTDFLAAIP